MKTPEDPVLVRLALDLTDRRPVDWDALEAAAAAKDRSLFRRLRQIEAVANIHGETGPSDVSSVLDSIGTSLDTGDEAPRTWGPLQIQRKIGRGSYGDVYLAWDSSLGRTVALKLLRHRDDRPGEAMVHEGHLLARVRHPNVVSVYGAEKVAGRVGLWMQYVEGGTLEEELQRRGPLPPDEVRHVGAHVASALSAVHDAGLLHRDIKAQNVMRTSNGQIVLMDFGAGEASAESRTAARAVAGTPLYLAPELLAGSPATVRSDIYSLGVLLFHLATGSYPVVERSIADLRKAHRSRTTRAISNAALALPHPLARVISKATDPEPRNRFASSSEMERALAAVAIPASRRFPMVLAVVTICVASALGLLFGWRSSRLSGSSDLVVRQIRNSWTRPAIVLALHPSGRVFACVDRQTRALHLCDAQGSGMTRIGRDGSATSGVQQAAFSPDGDRIAYVWRDRDASQLRLVNADGTEDRAVAEPYAAGSFIRFIQWGGHDSALVQVTRSGDPHRIGLIDMKTGSFFELLSLTTPPNGISLSAGGSFLVFEQPQPGDASLQDLWLLDTRTGSRRSIVADPGDDIYPVWSPDAHALFFSSTRRGTRGLWKLWMNDGAALGEPVFLRDLGRDVLVPTGFTTDGRLFCTVQTGWMDVYDAPVDLIEGTAGPGRRITTQPLEMSSRPTWAADGRRFAFVAGTTGPFRPDATRVVVVDTRTGAEARWPFAGVPYQSHMLWSPKEDEILLGWFDRDARRVRTEIRDAATGATRRSIALPAGYDGLRWTKEADGVFYSRDRAIFVHRFATETSERVITAGPGEGFTGFSVNPMTGELAVLVVDGAAKQCRVQIVREDGTPPVEVGRLASRCASLAWMPDGQHLLAGRLEGNWDSTLATNGAAALWSIDRGGTAPKRLPLVFEQIVGIAVHPSGKRVLVGTGFPRNESWIIENLARE